MASGGIGRLRTSRSRFTTIYHRFVGLCGPACANCLEDARTAMKTSIRDKSIETSLESIKTEVINLKAAIVSTDTKTTVNGHTATLVTPDDQSKMGIRINGVPEPSNQKLHDRMDSDI